MRLDEKQRGDLHLFNNDLFPGFVVFFFLWLWEENLTSILKEKLGFSYVPMIPDAGTFN